MISYAEFEKVDIRVGRITRAEPFPQARKPAIKLWVDFGPGIGEKRSSAQLSANYTPEGLVGRQVLAVVNFPPRQIGPVLSEVLVLAPAMMFHLGESSSDADTSDHPPPARPCSGSRPRALSGYASRPHRSPLGPGTPRRLARL